MARRTRWFHRLDILCSDKNRNETFSIYRSIDSYRCKGLLRYSLSMRRYSLFITLLLSLLLPLHVAASTLLSAPSCPAKSTMTVSSTDKAASDCCDEDGKMDCQQMQSCHGCNISCQVFSFAAPTFSFTSEKRFYLGIATPFVASFDPASVWRPPTNS